MTLSRPVALILLLILLVAACSPQSGAVTPAITPPAATATPVPPISVVTAQPAATQSNLLSIDFDGLPGGVPPEWVIRFASFDAGSRAPEVIKAQAQEDRFLIDNLGTHSGLYALYTGPVDSPDLQLSIDAVPDGEAMGVYLVCRYSNAGWYQFRVSNGGSSIQWVQPQGETFNAVVLAEGPGVFLDDGPHRLSGICRGTQLRLLADGKEVLRKEADFLPTGSFGFGTEAYDKPSRKLFDNLEVEYFPGALAAAEPVAAATATPEPATPTAAAAVIPMATPTAAATARPTAFPEDMPALYSTEFDDDDPSLDRWRTFAYSFASRSLGAEGFTTKTGAGFYRIKAGETNQRAFAIYDADLGADVDLSMKVPAPKPPAGVMQQAGLVCRYSEAGWYQFMLEPGEHWTIRLARYDPAGALHFYKLGEGVSYFTRSQNLEIRAECKGDRLTFYANGEKLASLHEATLPEGKVGLAGWSFSEPGQVALIDRFSARRAGWSESSLVGPAPTPGVEGVLYTTEFGTAAELTPYWFSEDTGEVSGPGSTLHTLRYINDFDPGTGDVEIRAGMQKNSMLRALLCRYSEDGWYEARYWKDVVVGDIVMLFRMERGQDGILREVGLGGANSTGGKEYTLSLRCAGSQISIAENDQTLILVEDGTFTGGRYGFTVRDNLPIKVKNAFSSYTVRRTQPAQPGDVTASLELNSAEAIGQSFGLNPQDPRFQVQDGALLIDSTSDVVRLNSNEPAAADVEATLEMEFLNDAGFISLGCRGEAPPPAFQAASSGWWAIFANDQLLASGTSPAIRPDRNSFTFSCVGDRLSFSANGTPLATLTYSVDASHVRGPLSIDVFEGAQARIDRIAVKSLRSAFDAVQPAAGVGSRAVLPIFEPGALVFRTDFSDLGGLSGGLCRNARRYTPSGWEGSCAWYGEVHGAGDAPLPAGFYLMGRKDVSIEFRYGQELSDLPVVASAEAVFGEPAGAVSLTCRSNSLGRYEFTIWPDGKWAITRTIPDGEGIHESITTLTNGQSPVILPERNQLTAACQGSELVFSANGTELGRAQDDWFVDGKVGVGVGPHSNATFANFSLHWGEEE